MLLFWGLVWTKLSAYTYIRRQQNKDKQLMHRQRSGSYNNKHRAYSQIFLRPPQRLVFPNKQAQEGYVGKKQFIAKTKDNVILESPDSLKYQRKDKLDINDIQGTRPKYPEMLENVLKYHKRENEGENHLRRVKTQASDSLDTLISDANLRARKPPSTPIYQRFPNGFQTRDNANSNVSKSDGVGSEIEKYLLRRHLELSKQNILGAYRPSLQQEQRNNIIRSNLINPTYLSSLKNV